jgi:hypothetical protein
MPADLSNCLYRRIDVSLCHALVRLQQRSNRMYLHSATFSPSKSSFDGKPPKYEKGFVNALTDREIEQTTVLRNVMKDPTSSKLQIKGPKQAEALHFVEKRKLKAQISVFPEGLLEDARRNYILVQNDKRKSLQDFQCNILIKLEGILKDQMSSKGENIRKFHIGGHDGGTYGTLMCLLRCFLAPYRISCSFS